VGFVKDPKRYVPIPAWARPMRVRAEERLHKLTAAAESCTANRIEWRDRKLGIITASVAYQYVRDIFPEASVLKLGWSYPFPEKLIREFAAGVEKLLVVEELDDFIEEHVRSMGIACEGRSVVPGIGELSPNVLEASRAKLEGREIPVTPPIPQAADLPPRPPVLCPSCPHRGIFYALHQLDVVVTGDIGCYSLGVLEPLSRIDTILCMGGGVTLAHGMQKAGEKHKVVGIVGDSTFFHSGITGLLNIAYNKGTSTIIVVDNRTTAMTGHQDHPGTGRTLMGEDTISASIQEIGKACGVRRVRTVNPYDIEGTLQILKEEIEADEASLVVSSAVCPLDARIKVGETQHINEEACVECRECLELGCPAMEARDGRPVINEFMCGGCQLCTQVCPISAIAAATER
jgi:indolepyruvate ferredoxin oxidoreductase, alpha subunit